MVAAESRFRDGSIRHVADPSKRPPAGDLHPHLAKLPHHGRHEPLPTGLVDHAVATLDHRDGHPSARCFDRRRQPGGATAHDDQIERASAVHACTEAAVRSAFSSQAIRQASNGRLTAVNSAAVIQAVCTKGSANPSTTTAR